ncbi:hypothetical protein ADUPG1_010919, partial [Aduncisulcus paluster]
MPILLFFIFFIISENFVSAYDVSDDILRQSMCEYYGFDKSCEITEDTFTTGIVPSSPFKILLGGQEVTAVQDLNGIQYMENFKGFYFTCDDSDFLTSYSYSNSTVYNGSFLLEPLSTGIQTFTLVNCYATSTIGFYLSSSSDTLEYLRLENAGLADSESAYFWNFTTYMSSWTAIKTIIITKNPNLTYFCGMISEGPSTLTTLNLSDNALSEFNSQLVHILSGLRTLILDNNPIGNLDLSTYYPISEYFTTLSAVNTGMTELPLNALRTTVSLLSIDVSSNTDLSYADITVPAASVGCYLSFTAAHCNFATLDDVNISTSRLYVRTSLIDTLDLSYNSSLSSVEQMKTYWEIKTLNLSHCSIVKFGYTGDSIYRINLASNPLTSTLNISNTSSNLQYLNLDGSGIFGIEEGELTLYPSHQIIASELEHLILSNLDGMTLDFLSSMPSSVTKLTLDKTDLSTIQEELYNLNTYFPFLKIFHAKGCSLTIFPDFRSFSYLIQIVVPNNDIADYSSTYVSPYYSPLSMLPSATTTTAETPCSVVLLHIAHNSNFNRLNGIELCKDSLKSLVATNCNLGDAGVLADFPSLTDVKLSNNHLFQVHLRGNSSVLHHLSLDLNYIHSLKSVSPLGLIHASSVKLTDNFIADLEGMSYVGGNTEGSSMTSMENSLSLGLNNLSSYSLTAFSRRTNFSNIRLSGNINISDITPLYNNKNLQGLTLSDTFVPRYLTTTYPSYEVSVASVGICYTDDPDELYAFWGAVSSGTPYNSKFGYEYPSYYTNMTDIWSINDSDVNGSVFGTEVYPYKATAEKQTPLSCPIDGCELSGYCDPSAISVSAPSIIGNESISFDASSCALNTFYEASTGLCHLIEDTVLRDAICISLGYSPSHVITVAELRSLTSIEISAGVSSMAGLEYAVNLTTLVLMNGTIEDISPVAYMHNLVYLDLRYNPISDIFPILSNNSYETIYMDNICLSYSYITDFAELLDTDIFTLPETYSDCPITETLELSLDS